MLLIIIVILSHELAPAHSVIFLSSPFSAILCISSSQFLLSQDPSLSRHDKESDFLSLGQMTAQHSSCLRTSSCSYLVGVSVEVALLVKTVVVKVGTVVVVPAPPCAERYAWVAVVRHLKFR